MRTLEQSPADGFWGSRPIEEQFLRGRDSLVPWERWRLGRGRGRAGWSLAQAAEGLGTPRGRGCLAAGAGLAGLPGLKVGAGSPEEKYLPPLLFPRASIPWERC